MARRLGAEKNELRLVDNLSGSEIILYYRMPTGPEHIQYTNSLTKRKGNKIKSNIGETRQKFGLKILAGIGEDSFERQNEKGEWVPISSEPSSKHYCPDWKDLVAEQAPDIVETLAMRVFESSTAAAVSDDEEDNDDPQGEDAAGNLPETSTP